MCYGSWPHTDLCGIPDRRSLARYLGVCLRAELCLIEQTYMLMICQRAQEPNFPRAKQFQHSAAFGHFLLRPCFARAVAIGAIFIAARKFVLFPTSKSRFSKLSPIRPSSLSRTSACSKKSRSATRNCARRWSIRRQRPRCSASSAARRRTCSRCSTPSSRAPRGFVGLMTWCCDFRGRHYGSAGSFWSHTRWPVEISIDEPQFRWMREHGTLHIPDVRRRTISQWQVSASGWRTLLAVPLRQQGELIGALGARRTEVRPFTRRRSSCWRPSPTRP